MAVFIRRPGIDIGSLDPKPVLGMAFVIKSFIHTYKATEKAVISPGIIKTPLHYCHIREPAHAMFSKKYFRTFQVAHCAMNSQVAICNSAIIVASYDAA